MSSARRPKTKPTSGAERSAPTRQHARPPPLPSRARTPESSLPEIRYEYAPVGRETLSAISDEVADEARELIARRPGTSAPEISFSETAAGRDTVSAIAREVSTHAATAVRPRVTTLDYSSRPLESELAAREALPSETTIDALAEAIGQSEPDLLATDGELEISEMVTFVVRGADPSELSTDKARVQFVQDRLIHRLPVESIAQVLRVDVTPWTVRGTLIVRVWCRID